MRVELILTRWMVLLFAVPLAAVTGACIAVELTALDLLVRCIATRPADAPFALLGIAAAGAVGLIVGAMSGALGSGAMAIGYLARAGCAMRVVMGALAVVGAVVAVLMSFGFEQQMVWWAAYASTAGCGGVILVAWWGEQVEVGRGGRGGADVTPMTHGGG